MEGASLDPPDRHLIEAAAGAARAAGRIQRDAIAAGEALHVDHKGRYDLVTDVDRRSEQAIVRMLQAARPGSSVLAEEGGARAGTSSDDETWIIDPLDGTTNYARGYPFFCVSVALSRAGQVVLGVVYDPLRDEMFEALRGQGARCNQRPVQVSPTAELGQALLATGFPYDRLDRPGTNLDRFCAMTMRTRGVRRDGAAALDLCYTACGRLDAYWEIGLNPWDVAAGALLVLEAGGTLSDLQGGPFDWNGQEVVASNGRLHQALVSSLADPWPPGPCYG